MNERPANTFKRFLQKPVTPNIGSLLVGLGLLACIAYVFGTLVIPQQGWTATLLNQRVHFTLVKPNTVFNGRFRDVVSIKPCLIEVAINPEVMEQTGSGAYFSYITAHEVGHCFDARILHNTHGHLQATQGYLDMYPDRNVAEAETYADAYALRYLQTCNTNLTALGWPGDPVPCTLPDPHSITVADTRTDPLGMIFGLTPPAAGNTFPPALLDFRSRP